MKTLIQVNIEPRVGMVVEALKGRYKHLLLSLVTGLTITKTGELFIQNTSTLLTKLVLGLGLSITISSIITALLRCQITDWKTCLSQPSSILVGFQRLRI